MWLFSQKGMFSIVEDSHSKNQLVVRSRIKGDIEKYWPLANVQRNDDTDYLYRAVIPRHDVAYVINNMVQNIDYTNFKASIDDDDGRRGYFYLRVWEAMIDMQETFKDEEEANR